MNDKHFEHKPGFGSIFSNKDAKAQAGPEAENWPDVRGAACCPHCSKSFDIAAWWKKAKKDGAQFLSVKLSLPKDGKGTASDKPF